MMKLKNSSAPLTINLDGPDGNAFVLLGTARSLARQLDMDEDAITKEMQSGDYMNLVKTMDKYFPFVVFETNNPEYMEAFHA